MDAGEIEFDAFKSRTLELAAGEDKYIVTENGNQSSIEVVDEVEVDFPSVLIPDTQETLEEHAESPVSIPLKLNGKGCTVEDGGKDMEKEERERACLEHDCQVVERCLNPTINEELEMQPGIHHAKAIFPGVNENRCPQDTIEIVLFMSRCVVVSPVFFSTLTSFSYAFLLAKP